MLDQHFSTLSMWLRGDPCEPTAESSLSGIGTNCKDLTDRHAQDKEGPKSGSKADDAPALHRAYRDGVLATALS